MCLGCLYCGEVAGLVRGHRGDILLLLTVFGYWCSVIDSRSIWMTGIFGVSEESRMLRRT